MLCGNVYHFFKDRLLGVPLLRLNLLLQNTDALHNNGHLNRSSAVLVIDFLKGNDIAVLVGNLLQAVAVFKQSLGLVGVHIVKQIGAIPFHAAQRLTRLLRFTRPTKAQALVQHLLHTLFFTAVSVTFGLFI